MENRPVGRKKKVTEGGSGVHRRGEGLGTGPIGQGGAPTPDSGHSGGDDGGMKRSSGRSPLFMIIILLVLFLGGGGGLSSLLGGGNVPTSGTGQGQGQTPSVTQNQGQSATVPGNVQQQPISGMPSLSQLLGGYGSYSGASVSAAPWSGESNVGKLNRDVDPKARAKRTVIKGDGKDIVTIMVYMCGADLESRGAMATKDIQEMLKADLGNNINLLIYTGGSRNWQNNVVSSTTNQIYQIKGGKMILLQDNVGNLPMTKPDTLSAYIKWGAKNYPADRYELIFWNHGGGSTGGYGYDERFVSAGAMSLSGINKALKDGGVTFDFVGFDTCLMATVENALLVSNYADYLIASEETEPGVGWYYTDWLTEFGKNTSMDTLDIGKNIIDSFTEACARTCPGQKTTLSITDLAELSQTVPSELTDFAKDTTAMINNNNFETVSSARSSTREFASKIDQVDLVDFATKVDTKESKELAEVLRSAIKYNRTANNMTNAYGLSIYFPYAKASKVDSMVNTYVDIGMDAEYAKCIQKFAALGTAGQVAGGGTQSPMPSLFGELGGSSGGGSSAEMITQLLTTFLSSDFSSVSGLSSTNTSFLGRELDVEQAAEYIAENSFDASAIKWTKNSKGEDVISLSEDEWKKVKNLTLNMFYDDGEGYVNLGMDTVFEFDDEGNLKSQGDKTWLSIDGQVVAYYVTDIQGDSNGYRITGQVPCYINDERANLILVFDSENEDGYVAGACYDYKDGETETSAKNITELEEGATIDYICEFYSYDKKFEDTYYLGERKIFSGSFADMEISNTYVGDSKVLETYCFTDMFGQEYWSPALEH